jgi:hypothetical protein
MDHRELPRALRGTSFRTAQARAAGVGRGRLRGADLRHPFHGTYVDRATLDLRAQCLALSLSLSDREWFSHRTAARLYGMPLPGFDDDDEPLHVTSIEADDRPRPRGVVGWRVLEVPPARRSAGGLRLIDPADVWASLSMRSAVAPGRTLSEEWITAIGDFLISGERTEYGRLPALCTITELSHAAARRQGKRGVKAVRAALEMVRRPVDSVKETFLRLGLVQWGAPEPIVQLGVQTSVGLRHADLGYPDERLLLEFQGDHHRTSRRQWLEDLTRVQLFQDAGYRVFLIGDADLAPDCRHVAARVTRALRA